MTPQRTRTILLASALVGIAFAVFFVREIRLLPDGRLHVHVLDIGQGDSILLVSPTGKQVLIDGGPNSGVIEPLGKHFSFFDRSLDLVVLTHPDLDHSGGIPEVLHRYHVDAMLLTGIRKEGKVYGEILQLIREKNIPVVIADPAKDIDLGDGVVLDVIWPPPTLNGVEVEEANDTSIVLRAFFGTGSMLFTGDIGEKAEEAILASGADIDADILKVPHHGSKTSSSTGFLLAITPRLAVISAGRKNQFGHPTPLVVDRYRHFGIPLRVTAEEGTISLDF